MVLAFSGIQQLDWVVIAVYFLAMLCIGFAFAPRQKNTEEYFLGGRSMPSWMVGISIIATLVSTISYLATPGEMIKHGLGWFLSLLSLPLSYLLVVHYFVPFFMRLPITSAYEYLEERFGGGARATGAVLFIIIRVVWMSVVIYTASLAMSTITGMRLPVVTLIVGSITTVYATVGGIRAVIWTDVIQFLILFSGALLPIGYVTATMGLGEWTSLALHETKLDVPLWSWDPGQRLTVVGAVLISFCWYLCTYSSDQVVIQRFLTTRDEPAARRSLLINCISDAMLMIVLGIVGLALLAIYTSSPERLADEMAGQLHSQADKVFPYFIAHQLPVGLRGLIIAALFSAAMSSLGSGVNSVSTVITVDFYGRWWQRGASDRASLWFGKRLALGLGLATTVLALFAAKIGGNIVELTNKSTGFSVGPLFGLFALGMFTRRGNQVGAMAGAVVGLVVGLLVTYSGQWFGYSISFIWILPVSIVATIVVGYLASLSRPGPSDGQLQFTHRAVMAGGAPAFSRDRQR